MKITTNGKWLLVVAVAMLCFAPCALAQTQLTFEGPGGNSYDGYYTYPYYVQVGVGGPTYAMIDDDLNSPLSGGQYWNATANSISNLSQLQFSGEGTLANVQLEYKEALSLAQALLFSNAGALTVAGGNANLLQEAIWYIFEPDFTTTQVGGVSNPDWTTIQALIAWAATHPLTPAQLADWIIWTPTACVGETQTDGCLSGNEMFQLVPEGGAALLYLLLAGVSCFGAMFFRSRNQSSRPGMA